MTKLEFAAYNTANYHLKGDIALNSHASALMSIPAPCGLAITSVTSDDKYLYALQPDRKTVYKLDVCGRIICVFKVSRKLSGLHYCSGRFYATSQNSNTIYIFSKCFSETGAFIPNVPDDLRCAALCAGGGIQGGLFIGPAGNCNNSDCLLSFATCSASYFLTPSGRTLSEAGTSGNRLYYTAVAENNGVLYEGLESATSEQTFVRATLLSSGQSKLQRLPFGYRVRSFFCYGGRFYAFVTKNSYHAYVAAVCTYIYDGVLGGEIIALPDDSFAESCCEESCSCGKHSKCNCASAGSSCSSCGGVSSNNSTICGNSVSGESTDTARCDINELCRIFSCIKKLCASNSVGGCGTYGNNSCNGVGGIQGGACCPDGTLSCTCYPLCECDDSETGGIGCLPLPECPPFCVPCEPCEPCRASSVKCSDGTLKVSSEANSVSH
ncbi:MAG: hypothetical protein IKV97_01470 [Clostridia bacterium]|nr:hypothetical protein [Clostridia bacterium]